MSDSTMESELLARLEKDLSLLVDKPEESVEATLSALWWMAAGRPCSVEKAASLGERPALDAEQSTTLRKLIEERIGGVPLAHLTGRQEFLGVELLASSAALIPRKETEILGRAALGLLRAHGQGDKDITLLDVCTGSGNVVLALSALVKTCNAFGADISEEAIGLASENARFLDLESRVEFRAGDLIEPYREILDGRVDLLTCNPPYISSAKVGTMATEISEHEPSEAFDGGPFGVGILMRLLREAPGLLRSGGWLVFELGLGQGPAMLKRIEKSPDFEAIQSFENQDGEIRALAAQRS